MSNPINLYLTKDIGLFLLEFWVTSLVGAMVRIVYGRVGATHAPGSAQASGSARSRTYITDAGTASASADFLSALPLIPRFLTAAESMRDVFDIYTIIFLALAVFIFLRLRSVPGQRTGRERPPYDPYSARDAVRPSTNDNVVALPGRGGIETPPKPVEPGEPSERWKGIAEPGSAVAVGLDAIVREDPSFDAKHFIAGARAAYEMTVTAYAEGDRRNLKNLLSKDVFDGVDAAIRER